MVDKDLEVKLTDDIYFQILLCTAYYWSLFYIFTIEDEILVFSGDIGQDDDVLLFPPIKPKKADYVFLESTYGNRLHPNNDLLFELE